MDERVRDIRKQGFVWWDKRVMDLVSERLGIIGFAVYNAYCYYSNGYTGRTFVSLRKIAEKLGIDKDTVAKYRNILVEEKLISLLPPQDGAPGEVLLLAFPAGISSDGCPSGSDSCPKQEAGVSESCSDKVSETAPDNSRNNKQNSTDQDTYITRDQSRAFFAALRDRREKVTG